MKVHPRVRSLLILHFLLSAAAAGQGEFSVKEENGVRAEMRDGVSLVADIFRPDQDGTFPVLLQRTPFCAHSPGHSRMERELRVFD